LTRPYIPIVIPIPQDENSKQKHRDMLEEFNCMKDHILSEIKKKEQEKKFRNEN